MATWRYHLARAGLEQLRQPFQMTDGHVKLLNRLVSPKERANQVRKANPHIDAEWDFSACPNKDVEEWDELCFWEYAREIPSIHKYVQKLRVSCNEKNFDCYWSGYGQQLRKRDWRKIPRTYDALFYFAPEWPANAYLSVAKKERERRRRVIYPAVGKEFMAGIVQESLFVNRYLDTSFWEDLRNALSLTGKPTIQHDTKSADAIFNIDWHLSDPQLKEGFAAWLELNRPVDTNANRRGEGQSLIKRRQTELRQLAAWRLLQKLNLNYETAEELTRKNGQKSLYNGQAQWLEAKRVTEDTLQEMTRFVTGGKL